MRKYISLALLTLSLGVTVPAVKAQYRDGVRVQRYYDRDARDYHEWNGNEERAYRYYLRQQRLRERDWRRMNRRQQMEYWRWRHSNPDSVIFRLNIR